MAQRLLNIEIGERFVNICATQVSGRNYKVLKGFRFEFVGDIVNDGQITNIEEMAEQIRTQLEEHGLSEERNATFVFSSTKVPYREITLPLVKPNKLPELVAMNAGDHFPVDLSNYHITHTVLEKLIKPEPGYRVLVTAVPMSILKSYFDLANSLGVVVQAVDYAANSQMQIFSSMDKNGVAMYLSINLFSTTATFMQDGQFLMQRSIPMGADDIITTVLRQNDFGASEYIDTLEKCKDSLWLSQHLPKDIFAAASNRLFVGIGRMLEFFYSNKKGITIDKIVLLGICSEIAGIREEIEAGSSVKTEILTAIPKHENTANVLEGSIVNYISCIGSIIAPLDLIPQEYKRENQKTKNRDNSMLPSILLCALAIIAGGALSLTAWLDNLSVNAKLNKVNNDIAELQYVVEGYNTYVEYVSMHNNLKVVTDASSNQNENLPDFLSELEEIIPESILFMSVLSDNNGVTINATVDVFEDVAVTLANIRSMESISVLSVSSATEQGNGLGDSVIAFSVTATYVQDVEEPTEALQPIVTEPE